MTEPLPDAVKLLNQRLMAEGCVSAAQLKQIWGDELADHDKGDLTTLKKALKASTAQLSTVGLEIRGIAIDDEMYYSIINKQNDAIAKAGFQSAFTTSEINYIRLIIGKIVEEDGSCTRATLVNAKNSLKEKDALKLDEATKIVNRLVKDHWLTEHGNKKSLSMQAQLKLGPRTYMELSYMLIEQFGVDKTEIPQQCYF